MKTHSILIVKLAFILLLVAYQSGCRTKELHIEKAESSEIQNEDIRIGSRQSASLSGSSMIRLTDSGSQFFRIRIFPLDTFTLSLQNGFKGRASSIELAGLTEHMKMVNDSAAFNAETHNTVQIDQQSKSSRKEKVSSKELEKSRLTFVPWLVLLGLAALAVLWRIRLSAQPRNP